MLDPLLGRADLASRVLEHKVKGNLVESRSRWVQTHFGRPYLEELANTLTGQARQWLLEPPLALAWCSMATLFEMDGALVAGPMEGDPSRFFAFGEEVADYNLATLYKVMFRLGTPAFVLRNLSTAYRAYIRPGKTHTEIHSKTDATVTLEETILPHYYCAYGVSGWIAAAVTKSGGEGVKVEHATCHHRGDDSCSWRARWS